MANEPFMENQFREINCSPLMFGDVIDSCMKHWSRHGDGTVVIVKGCHSKMMRDNLRMKPDECVHSAANNTACTCNTDLCNSASNLNHWVTSIIVTFCILFAIYLMWKNLEHAATRKLNRRFFFKFIFSKSFSFYDYPSLPIISVQ